MKGTPRLVLRSLLLVCLALPACAPPRGIMTYEQVDVTGRPRFNDYGDEIPDDRFMTLWIKEGIPVTHQMVWWDNEVLDRRRIDPKRRYQFKLLNGKVIDYRGTKHEHSEVWQAYDPQQRLVYDASFCRVHDRTMQRESHEQGIDAERLPRGFDAAKARSFPNSRFVYPVCSGQSTYTSLSWTCPQCSEAETKWLEKHPKPPHADLR